MANKKFKAPEHFHFVPVGFVVDNIFQGGSFALSLGYIDHAGAVKDNIEPEGSKGRYVQYVQNKDDKGRDVGKRFRFDQSLGRIMTRPSDRDIYGKSQYEFLKNHPDCEGSPNGTYVFDEEGNKVQTGVTFRELNSAKDAEIALRADKARVKAEMTALTLDEKTLEEIANIIGYFGDVDEHMSLKVCEFARKKPGVFEELLNSDNRSVRALIRKAVQEGVFRLQGALIKWENTTVGVSEDDAIAKLMTNKEMTRAIQQKLGVDFVAEESKSPARKVKEQVKED